MSRHALCGLLLALAGCNSGPQILGWEGASQSVPTPLPWFGGPSYYAHWPRGFPNDSGYFPIGVWMQNPANAARFQAIGVNHYVGLWQGPTQAQVTDMVAAGMHVVCEQAGVWQQQLDTTSIQGWLKRRTSWSTTLTRSPTLTRSSSSRPAYRT